MTYPNTVISMPSQLFTMARSFKACSNGNIYIGMVDTDPTIPENQIQVYLENEEGSQVPVPQPIKINTAGYPVYSGQIQKFVTDVGHSMAVYDNHNTQQFYFPNVYKYTGSSSIDLHTVAVANGVSDEEVAYLFLGDVEDISYFYDPATGKVFYATEPVTGEITAIGNTSHDMTTVTVDGSDVEIITVQFKKWRDDFDIRGWGATQSEPCHEAVQNALLDTNSAYIPPGEWVFNRVGAKQVNISASSNITIKGAGSARTKIKLDDGTLTGNFQQMFSIVSTASAGIEVDVSGITIDCNATGNPNPGGSGSFDWQHNHAIYALPTGLGGILVERYTDIVIIDPVADGISLSGSATNTRGDCLLDNILIKDRNRVRSDITVTSDYDAIVVTNCILDKFEIETNSTNTDNTGNVNISNCIIKKSFDVIYKTNIADMKLSNCTIDGELNLDGYNLDVSNCTFNLTSSTRLTGEGIDPIMSYNFIGCTFKKRDDYVSSSSAFIRTESVATSPAKTLFDTCKFYVFDADTESYVYSNPNAMVNGMSVEFNDCEFYGTTTIADIYIRSGDFSFNRNKHYRESGHCITQDSLSWAFVTNRISIKDCEAVNTSGALYSPPVATYQVDIYMSGNTHNLGLGSLINFTRYDKIMPPRGTGDVLNFITIDTEDGTGKPTTGKYVAGMKRYESAPSAGSYIGYVAVTNGSPATWKGFGVIES